MKNNSLKIFVEVAECKSFSKAEKHLFLSKQAIVKQIDNLERDLDFELFYRSNQGVTLTPAGSMYYNGVKELLSLSEQLVQKCQLHASSKQILRIEKQRPPQMLLQGAINELKCKHPHIKLDISLSPDYHSGERILNDLIDVAEVPGCKDIQQPGIGYTKLICLPYRCLLHESHPLAKKDQLTPMDLSGMTIAVNNLKFRHQIIDWLTKRSSNITFVKAIGQELEQIYNTCYNNEIFLSTSFFTDQMTNIKSIPLQCDLTQEVGLIHRTNPSAEVQLFLSIAKKYCNSL